MHCICLENNPVKQHYEVQLQKISTQVVHNPAVDEKFQNYPQM